MKKKSSQSGQAMGLTVLVLLALCLFTFMIVNFFQVTYWRMRMQNAADAAALSYAYVQARGLNDVATLNSTVMPIMVQKLPGVGMYCVEKNMVSVFKTTTQLMQARVRAASGGFLSIIAREVAKQNGADSPGGAVGGYSLKLKAKRANVYIYKWVTVPILGTIPVPWAPFVIKRYQPIYYMRTWEPGTKKAQPTHKIVWNGVTKKMSAPFAGSFLGIKKASDIKANASAEVWLDLRNSVGHNGGFPRTKDDPFFLIPISQFPAFNGRLCPVPLMQH